MYALQRSFLIATVLVAPLAPAVWADDAGIQSEYRETIDKSFPLKAGGAFTLSNKNGSIEFDTWDKEEVHIVAEKRMRPEGGSFAWLQRLIGLKSDAPVTDASARAIFEQFTIEFSGDDSNRIVDTHYPSESGVNFDVSYRITTPRRVVTKIKAVNGSVRLANVEGDTTIDTTSGNVSASNVTGAIHAESTNGRITLEDIAGPINAETTNGSVSAVVRSAASLPGPISLQSTNGGVRLSVPPNAAFELELRTVNGSVSCNLPLSATRDSTRRRLEGTVGAGGPQVTIRTTNGGVRVEAQS